jgi:hypothetical protein
LREEVRTESIVDLLRTLFICSVLSLASIFLNNDARSLVLEPLERIIEKVRYLSKDPVSAAAGDNHYQAGVYSFAKKVQDPKECN